MPGPVGSMPSGSARRAGAGLQDRGTGPAEGKDRWGTPFRPLSGGIVAPLNPRSARAQNADE